MRFRIMPLEERIVLDAAGAVDILNSYHLESVKPVVTDTHDAAVTSDSTPLNVDAPVHSDPGLHILVVSSHVTNSEILASVVKDPASVVMYDANTTSLDALLGKIGTLLNGRKADSIAFANEGSPGQFQLTADIAVSMETLNASQELRGFWDQIGKMVKDNGRIDLLACNVAFNSIGVQLVSQIDAYADDPGHNVDIAASNDATGNAPKGDWILELGGIDASLYFTDQLSTWNGTLDATPKMISDIVAGTGSSNPTNIFLDATSGIIYFSATDASGDRELWSTRGTAATTARVMNINPTGSSSPSDFTNVDGHIFFVADNGVNGRELWRIPQGSLVPSLYKDVNPGSGSGFTGGNEFIAVTSAWAAPGVGSQLFFTANDGTNGMELWKATLNTLTAQMVSDIRPGAAGSSPMHLTLFPINDEVVFRADNGTIGLELWRVNYNTGGVLMLADTNPFPGEGMDQNTNPIKMVVIGDRLYFNGTHIQTVVRTDNLWIYDGTFDFVFRSDPLPSDGYTYKFNSIYDMTALGSTLYFIASTNYDNPAVPVNFNYYAIWADDPVSGTRIITHGQTLKVDSGVGPTNTFFLTPDPSQTFAYFLAVNSGTGGVGLYRTDTPPTGPSGSESVHPFYNLPFGAPHPTQAKMIDGSFYFDSFNNSTGLELIKSNGTAATTVVLDIYAGVNSSSPGSFIKDGGLLFNKALVFAATTASGRELWYVGNLAPVDLTVGTVNENVAVGTVIPLSSVDPDTGDTGTFTLVSGAGSTDNSSFIITGNQLKTNSAINFETKSSYSIRVLVQDAGGYFFEKALTVLVNNVNEAPTNITLSSSSINENVAAGSTVGTLTATDPDAGGAHTFTLVSGTGSTDNAAFQIIGNQLQIISSPNYEAQNSYSIRVRDTDNGGLTFEKTFTITVNNLNELPTGVQLTPSSINENVPANTVVGTLTASDPDVGNTHTFMLVAGTGDTDNASFQITGNQLSILTSPDFEAKSSYSIRVRTTDQNGAFVGRVLTITVNNVNETPTDITLSASTINENVPAGSSVGTLTATDPDAGGTHTFTLVAGTGSTDNAAFQISGNQLQIINSPDFETKSSYSVRVRDTDNGGLTVEKAFTITVNDINDAPSDILLSSSSINENVAVGTVVGTLTGVDQDPGATHTFALVSGTGSTDNALFQITGNQLKIAIPPNYEAKSSLSIRISDTDNGGMVFEKVFIITVNDVNEAPTAINFSGPLTIAENGPTNQILPGTLSATDPDVGNTHTFQMVSLPDSAFFQIVNGNQLRFLPSANYEAKSVYNIGIRVLDGANSFSQAFTFTITNVNEAPTDITLSSTSINENAAANTNVGAFTATDPDAPASESHTFTLVSGTGSTDNAAFTIAGNLLRNNASPDYETKNSYSIRVRDTDIGGLTFEKVFIITVNNLNEAPTDIILSSATIAENSPAGSTIGTLTGVDQDAGATHTFSLVSGTGSTDNAAFQISGNQLQIIASPDFEAKSSYSIRVRDTDNGGLTFEKVFTITVTNVNEAPTDISLSASSINENVAAGSTVGTLTATDQDAGGSHTFTLVAGTGSTDNAAFQISGNQLQIVASPNFEAQGSYSIRVRDTDNSGLTFEKVFTITVNNVNEAPTDISLSASSINENAPAGSTIGTLTGTDPDAGATHTFTLAAGTGSTDNAAFQIVGNQLQIIASPNYEAKSSYSIRIRDTDQGGLTFEKVFTITVNNLDEAPTDITLSATSINENVSAGSSVGTFSATDQDAGGSHTFTLVAGTGSTDNAAFQIVGNQLNVLASPDFEAQSSYSIRVRDTDNSGLTFEKVFTITVNNVNEAPTNILLSAASINENAAANSTVGTFSAVDPDAGGTHTFTLVSGTASTDNAAFQIVGGQLRILASPDFEAKNSYSIRVRDTDQGGLTFEKVFTITVNDVNEAPTDISLSASSINENAAAGSTIGTLSATDPDAGATHTFTLVSGTGSADNAAFQIVGNQLQIIASPDFEAQSSYSVRIRGTDQGGLTFEKAFVISVNDVNEAPTDITLSASSINENVPAGSTIGSFTGVDPDAGATHTFSLVSGTGSTDNAAFQIVGNQLQIIASPNYEAQSSYSIRVRDTDQGGLTFEKIFTITIIDVNEAPTDTTLSGNSIAENAPSGTFIGTLDSFDPEVGGTIVYSLDAGVLDNDYFSIVGNDLQSNAVFNYEGQSSYTIRVTVTDGGDSHTVDFVINVTNVNEAPTDINLTGNSIAENAPIGTSIGSLSSSDPDAGDTATYTLVSGALDNALFSITGNTLKSASVFDFEAQSSYSVRVRITDAGGLTHTEDFLISVTNVNEAPTDIALAGDTIAENAPVGTSIGSLSSTDPDASDTATYTLVSGALDNALFSITGNTLKSAAVFDFEAQSSYTVRVRITDSGGLSHTEDFLISVTNANEAPTDIALNGSTIAENAPIGTSIGSLSSSDPDAGDTVTYTLVSGALDNALFSITGNTLKSAAIFDFEAQSSYSVRVRVTDAGGLSHTEDFLISITNVNEAPVAANDSYSVAEDGTLNVGSPGVLGNDSDVDSGMTAVLDSGPAHGTLTLNADGSFSYTPFLNYFGPDSFTYHATDGSLDSAIATVSITVTAVNDAPVAANDSYSVAEDGTLNIGAGGVLSNDSDVDSGMTAVLDSGPAHGTLTLNADGSFSYTPFLNYFGPDSFTYHATDGSLDSAIATVSITITAVNDAPTAVNDSYSVAEDGVLNIGSPGVLSNDSDVDSSMTAVLDSGPTHGTLTLNADGSFNYTPFLNYFGPDSFTYHATDGSLDSAIATVSITVTAVNDAPVAANDNYSVAEDGTLTVGSPGVLSNDSDIDSGMTAVLDSGPAHGTLTLNADGSFSYTPFLNYFGPDSFTYHATDGSLDSAIATVSITITAVNDAPIAANDSYSVAEDGVLNIGSPGVLSNDSDVDSGMTAVLDSGPTHGTLTLNADGSFSYTPFLNYYGSDSFTYHATDGGLDSAIATVSITVTAVNDAPVAADDSYTVAEDGTLNIASPGILGNDSDVDSGMTAVLDAGPAHGTLTLNADGSFSYTPFLNYFGSDSFTYHATDGSLDSPIATVSITITAVNDAPMAANDSYSVAEDGTLTIGSPGVLSNDSDVDSGMTAVLDSGPAHGSLTLNADGSFSYTPFLNYYGSDSFTYHATDGSLNSSIATVSITVTPVNDAPVAAEDNYSVAESGVLTVSAPGVLSNDSDVDSPMTAVLDAGPSHGSLIFNADGSFEYTPNANFNGEDSFTYYATDGSLSSAITTVNITVTETNNAPVAANDSYSIAEDNTLTVSSPGILSNDSDIDSPFIAVLDTGPAHGTLSLNSDGSFSYTPDLNYYGSDSFTYHAYDGSLSSGIATVSITVTPVNDAPTAANDSYSVAEDGTLIIGSPGVLGNDSDIDSSMTAVLDTGPSNGTLTLNADGSFTYIPFLNYFGSDSFTYHATDGSLDSAIAIVTITVTPVNDAPTAANDSYSVAEDGTLNVGSPGVLGNDSDIDSAMTAVLDAGPSHGTLTLNADGSFSYTPFLNYYGPDSFTYHATDGSLDSAIATVSITVTAVNDSPVAANDNYSVAEDGVLNIGSPGVLGNDSDVDSSMTAVLDSGPAHGTLILNADGSFSYTPFLNYFGPDSFTYHATDGSLDSAIATVSITVTPVNDAPSAANDSYSVAEDGTLNVGSPGILGNDSDVDSSMTAVLDAGPSHGTLTLNADGSFSYTPFLNYNGPDSFTYHATDGSLNSAIATVSITVTSVNDAPIAENDSASIGEGQTLNGTSVLANDSDAHGGAPNENNTPLTVELVSGPSHAASFILNADGTYTYTRTAHTAGPDSFTYIAKDFLGGISGIATVSIDVIDAPLYSAPVNVAAVEGIASNNVVVAHFTDGDPGAPITNYTAIIDWGDGSALYTGTIVIQGDGFDVLGSHTYADHTLAGQPHVVTVSITSVDGSQTTAIGMAVVADAPLTGHDNSATFSPSVGVAVTGMVGTFSDANVNAPTSDFTAIIDWGDGSATSFGTVMSTGGGNFSVIGTHAYLAAGDYTIVVTINDIGGSTTSMSSLVHAVVSQDPVANADSYNNSHDANLPATITISAANGVLANDVHYNTAQSLTAALLTGPTHGSLILNSDGSFSYTAVNGFSGIDSFTYRAFDGTYSNAATVNINVNTNPILTVSGGKAVVFTEDKAAKAIAASTVVTDPDTPSFSGGTVTVTITQNATPSDRLTLIQGNGLTLVGNTVFLDSINVGTFTGGNGTPLLITFNGSATPGVVGDVIRHVGFSDISQNPSTAQRTVTFVLTDGEGGQSHIGTKIVDVQSVNDAPDITLATSVINATKNTLTAISGITISDIDSSSTDLLTVSLSVKHGRLNISSMIGLEGLTFKESLGATGLRSIIMRGTLDELNLALSRLTYIGDTRFTGTETLQIKVTDSGGSTIGGTATDSSSLKIIVS